MDFDEALNYLNGLLRFGPKLGLERFAALCHRMGDPQDRFKVLHIAGTKGKGSTTALAAAVLRAQGFKVGSYFSPYVFDPCERVQVDGIYVPHADFASIVTMARPHVEALALTDLGQTTEFELKTLIGFVYFAEREVDYACIEVGLGGRLDATNVVKPIATVITNIGLDHTNILGDTHALIAAEKAGIIKPGIPIITATDHPDALAVIRRIASDRKAPLAHVLRGPATAPTCDAALVRWNCDGPFAPADIATERHAYAGVPMRMAGEYQRANAACAVAAVELALGADGVGTANEAVYSGLGSAALPGRLTVAWRPEGPLLVLDGAHNGMAAEALATTLVELKRRERIARTLLVVGMISGHDPADVLGALAPDAETVYSCAPTWRRALPVGEITAAAQAFSPHVVECRSVDEAVRTALSAAAPNDMVLVTGSFYTVGETPQELLEPGG